MSWVGGPTASLNYGYDANGNVTNLRSGYANGVNLAYGYDALNRLTNVLSHGQLAAGYGYDPAGNLQAMRYGNGVTNLYQYDSLNRLTNLAWQAGSSPVALFAYRLDGRRHADESGGNRHQHQPDLPMELRLAVPDDQREHPESWQRGLRLRPGGQPDEPAIWWHLPIVHFQLWLTTPMMNWYRIAMDIYSSGGL